MEKISAIALVSGGMDSLVSAALALEKHKNVAFLHLSYGQRTATKELSCFHKIADFYSLPMENRKVFDGTFLQHIGGSSLTDKDIPVEQYRPRPDGDIPDSYVPFRNTHILSIAVSWAEVIGASYIYIGAVSEDSSGYPDCRPSYYQAFNQLVAEGTAKGDIQVVTPIISWSKKTIVRKAIELNAPLHLTWSCYQETEIACGVCDSCILRLRGFEQANAKDPLPYRTNLTNID